MPARKQPNKSLMSRKAGPTKLVGEVAQVTETVEKVRAPRREVPHEVKRRPNVLHLYGVDNLAVSDFRTYFEGHNILGIRWLDGSSCNLQFIDEFEAKLALLGAMIPEAKEVAREAGKEFFGYNWMACKYYKKARDDSCGFSGDEIDLFGRLATEDEANIEQLKYMLLKY
jgi:hypothetical protein